MSDMDTNLRRVKVHLGQYGRMVKHKKKSGESFSFIDRDWICTTSASSELALLQSMTTSDAMPYDVLRAGKGVTNDMVVECGAVSLYIGSVFNFQKLFI